MASTINPAVPSGTQPTLSSVRANFLSAYNEITGLQSYQASHAASGDHDARYLQISALDAAIASLGYIKGAPEDTRLYGMRDGVWVEIQNVSSAATETKFEALYPSASNIMTGVTVGTGSVTVGAVNQSVIAEDVDGVFRSYASTTPAWAFGRYSTGTVYSTTSGGAEILPKPKLQIDPAMTLNLAYTRSINTTGSLWTTAFGTGGVGTRTQDQVGIDGQANTATTLNVTTSVTDCAGWTQSLTSLTGSEVVTTSAFVKGVATATHTDGIQHIFAGGTSHYARVWINAETGAYGVNTNQAGLNEHSVTEYTINGQKWYRVTLTSTNLPSGGGAGTSCARRVTPAYGSVAGGAPVTNQIGSAVFDAVTSYVGVDHATAHTSPPILNDTATASQVRAAPAITFNIANHADTTSGYGIRLVSALSRADMASGNHPILSLVGNDLLYYDATAGAFKSTDTGAHTASASYDVVAGQEVLVTVTYDSDSNELQVGVNGIYGTAVAYSDGFATGTAITICKTPSHTWWAGELRRVGPVA